LRKAVILSVNMAVEAETAFFPTLVRWFTFRARARMQLVEQHVIACGDPRYEQVDAAAFAAKNLYNAANYLVRQAFIFERRYMGYAALFHLLKRTEAYTALPRKVSNDVLRQLDKNWRAFFAACEAYREDPGRFVGRPKLPKYKDKTRGRCLLI